MHSGNGPPPGNQQGQFPFLPSQFPNNQQGQFQQPQQGQFQQQQNPFQQHQQGQFQQQQNYQRQQQQNYQQAQAPPKKPPLLVTMISEYIITSHNSIAEILRNENKEFLEFYKGELTAAKSKQNEKSTETEKIRTETKEKYETNFQILIKKFGELEKKIETNSGLIENFIAHNEKSISGILEAIKIINNKNNE